MRSNKLWGGRFSDASDPLFSEFNDSLPFDHVLLEVDIQGSLAYARALERTGILTRKERQRMEGGLRRVLKEYHDHPERIIRTGAEDVHTFVERELERRIGTLALKLHTGRSRNDQVATDLRLYLKRVGLESERELNSLLLALWELCERSGTAILPGYTHTQRAQPVLFGHFLLAYGEQLLRDRQRLRGCLIRADRCPLGSGALSGTVYAVDRDALARDLGFSGASENSVDAVSDRDFLLEYHFFASVLMMHLSRLSEDLILYNSAEFGFIRMHDSVASGSSLMPQKKNPDALELIRAKAGRVYGHLVSLLTVLKGLPMAYNKDLQEDKEGLFDTALTVRHCLRAMTLVLNRLEVRSETMRTACSDGYLNATELADYLVSKGMPFRKAHDTVGRIVQAAASQHRRLEDLTLADYRRFSQLFEEDLYQWLPIERAVARRVERGGTAPVRVRRAIRAFHRRVLSGRG